MSGKTGFVYSEDYMKYDFGPTHPLRPIRLKLTYDLLRETKVLGDPSIETYQPRQATENELLTVHTKEYIEEVKSFSKTGVGYLDSGDTPAFKGVFEATQFAVGSTLACVERVAEGRLDHAFNPVGGLHHATRDSSAGFCVFNDIGIAIEVLRQRYGIKSILYVDIDVHHGDGVYYSYDSDPEVHIFDVHEDGRYIYPGTGFEGDQGVGPARGTKINVPLPPMTGDEGIEELLPRLELFAKLSSPEFIILQAGADGLRGDPIGGLEYTPDAHRMVARRLHSVAHELCKGRLVGLGGGGYSKENCAAAWGAVVRELLA